MAQDFAKRSKPRKKKQAPRRFSLGSFVLGVVTGVGLFLLGAYGPELLLKEDPTTIAQQTEPSPGAVASPTDGLTGEQEPPEQNLEFEFRDLLGTDSVNPDLSAYEDDVRNQQPKTPDGPMQFLLQSGSFLIQADAETRRGTILLLNMPANIVEAQIDNKIWYRVIVGPYAQRGAAQQAANKLRTQKISSIWMERPVTSG